MQIERDVIAVTTDGSGNATAYSSRPFTGRILGVHWIKPGSNAITGATFALTAEATGEPILSVSSVSASADWYPRGPVHTVAGVAQLYASAGLPVTDPIAIANDRVKIQISSGGANANGTFHIVVG